MDTPIESPERGFRSLTTRLIVWTLLAVGAVYAVTVVVSNSLARRMALAAAEREAVNETDDAAGRVADVLHSVEERTRVLADVLTTLDPAEREAANEIDSLASRVQDVLHAVEERTIVLAKAVETLEPDDEGLDRLLRRFVPGNPQVYGAAVAFEPKAGAPRVHYYHRRPGSPDDILSADLASSAAGRPAGPSRTATWAAARWPW